MRYFFECGRACKKKLDQVETQEQTKDHEQNEKELTQENEPGSLIADPQQDKQVNSCEHADNKRSSPQHLDGFPLFRRSHWFHQSFSF
jgi:hypothetical protein